MITKELLDIKVTTKANIYWNGKVVSRTCYRKDGSKFTLGIITTGTYTFDVGDKEVVSVKFSSVIHLTVDNYYLRGFGFISISV